MKVKYLSFVVLLFFNLSQLLRQIIYDHIVISVENRVCDKIEIADDFHISDNLYFQERNKAHCSNDITSLTVDFRPFGSVIV